MEREGEREKEIGGEKERDVAHPFHFSLCMRGFVALHFLESHWGPALRRGEGPTFVLEERRGRESE